MELPPFIRSLPAIDLPLPKEKVSTHAMQTEGGLAVFFVVHEDIEIPPHAHEAQWGTVLAGALTLTVDGRTHTYVPGESYDIPAGAEHSGLVPAGAILLDFFEEADRYALRK